MLTPILKIDPRAPETKDSMHWRGSSALILKRVSPTNLDAGFWSVRTFESILKPILASRS